MLNPTELANLYTILSDESKTFEQIGQNFQKSFSKFDQFKTGVTIWYLIKENLINLTQRLSAFFVLSDMYKNDSQTTPFIPLLLESLESSKINTEKKFLIDLLESKFTSSKTTVKQYIEDNKSLEEVKMPNMEQMWKAHNTTKEKCSNEISDWIRPIIYDNNTKSPDNMNLFDFTQMTPDEISYDYFEPNYLTYYPNSNYPFYEEEPMWILPTLKYEFIWDFTMSPEQESIAKLIHKAQKKETLTEEQKNYLLEKIGVNPNLLKEINFSPEALWELIEKNDELSTEIFFKISNFNRFENYKFEDYLSLFLKKPWSVNSMKVVNKLIQKVQMPDEFIISYLRHLINNYKKETESKNRLSRLIAFFILNLLDHEHIKISIIPSEINEIFTEKSKDEDVQKLQQKLNEYKNKN